MKWQRGKEFTITFEPDDAEDCFNAAGMLATRTNGAHGARFTQQLFLVFAGTDRHVQRMKNARLVIAHEKSGLSIRKFAESRAKPYGTTPGALDRQLRRLLKKRGADIS
ncbi:MAG: hypothetical protein WAK55_26705 [Xanthobacteraceae bacterium]